jgi:hypothetical protein
MHEGFFGGRLWISIWSPTVWLLACEHPVIRSAYSRLCSKHGTQPDHSAPSAKPFMFVQFFLPLNIFILQQLLHGLPMRFYFGLARKQPDSIHFSFL